jgi:hypothetical protein
VNFWEFLGLDMTKMAMAGAAGGIVRWATLRSNWKEGLGSLFIGAVCALYLAPLVEPLLEPIVGKLAPTADPQGFAGFIVGLGGIGLSGFLIEALTARTRKREGDNENK